jgi:K+-transporting ATPase KdpF subunit
MAALTWLAAITSVALLVYLLVALFAPEKLQ